MFSFCFLVHNEGREYLSKLFESMYKSLQADEEIIICDDNSTEETTVQYLNELKSLNDDRIKFVVHSLNNDFATHKNFLISQCTKDYVFLMDADESLTVEEYNKIREIIKQTPIPDLFLLHRSNILIDYNKEYKDVLDGFANYSNKQIDDTTVQVVTNCFQPRIWKNNFGIYFVNKVHEYLVNAHYQVAIPENIASIKHVKTCKRQREQSKLYETIQ